MNDGIIVIVTKLYTHHKTNRGAMAMRLFIDAPREVAYWFAGDYMMRTKLRMNPEGTGGVFESDDSLTESVEPDSDEFEYAFRGLYPIAPPTFDDVEDPINPEGFVVRSEAQA